MIHLLAPQTSYAILIVGENPNKCKVPSKICRKFRIMPDFYSASFGSVIISFKDTAKPARP